MKQLYLLAISLLSLSAFAAPVRFVVLSDTHIEAPEIVYDTVATQDPLTMRDTVIVTAREVAGEALQGLALLAEDIPSQSPDFILHAGDMTDRGDSLALTAVRELLIGTHVPFYVTSGNHETQNSPSALQDLRTVFDSVRFALNTNGLLLLGMNSGPILRTSDGHISPVDTLWTRQWLDSLGMQPTFLMTHLPLVDQDNWYDLTSILRQYNTQLIISGHHHENEHLTLAGFDNVVCRSALSDSLDRIGYTIVEVDGKNIRFSERAIALKRDGNAISAGEASTKEWLSLPLMRREFPEPDTALLPSYAVNDSDSLIVRAWSRQMPAGFYATPTERYGRIYIGDDNGTFYAFDMSNGKILWRYKTNRRIIGSSDMKDGRVVFGGANGTLYCLSVDNGKLLWRQRLGKPITGSVTISDNTVLVGSSDSGFYALKLSNGAPIWTYRGIGSYCIAKPTVFKNNVYFGAWDGYFYALDKRKGKQLWRWGSDTTYYRHSPAAVTPCADKQRVYIVAPDHNLTALRADSGTVSLRTDRWQVRESLGMKDSILYAKTMQDTIIAINLNTNQLLWATDAGYGFDYAPTQLIENEGQLFVTTKNGLVIVLDALTGELLWRHKIGNSLLTTPCPLPGNDVVVASTDGTIAMLHKREPILPDTTAQVADTLLYGAGTPEETLTLPVDTIPTE